MALATAWRGLHPRARERFVETDAPKPLRRRYYAADDGWRSPLFCVSPRPGGSGEPVLLLHGLAFGPQSLRYGAGPTLASTLADAGFAVYCAAHRGDRDALPPDSHQAVHLDAIVRHDLPAALAAAADDSGYRRVHVIGHGLGGQLALMLASTADPASVTAIASPVRFRRPRSVQLRGHRLLAALPSAWHLPTQVLARVGAAWLDGQDGGAGAAHAPGTPPARLRGALHHTVEDVTVGVLEQLTRWSEADSLVSADGSLDYVEAMVDAQAPLHLLTAPGDALAHPRSSTAVCDRWRGPVAETTLPEHLARLDCLLGADAPVEVFGPVVEWLAAHRRLAW